MQDNPFVILGISPDSTQSEITDAYKSLISKYREDRFLDGEAGANAAKMCTVVENAYKEAMDYAKGRIKIDESTTSVSYQEVEELIKNKKLNDAQAILDDIMDRDAEWHYYQALIYHRKNWLDECKKQLEIALAIDPNNAKYKAVLDKLNASRNSVPPFTQQANAGGDRDFHQGSPYNRPYTQNGVNSGGCCDCCSSLICADCCCECMGGDLISCC